jgi:hypothetical protein
MAICARAPVHVCALLTAVCHGGHGDQEAEIIHLAGCGRPERISEISRRPPSQIHLRTRRGITEREIPEPSRGSANGSDMDLLKTDAHSHPKDALNLLFSRSCSTPLEPHAGQETSTPCEKMLTSPTAFPSGRRRPVSLDTEDGDRGRSRHERTVGASKPTGGGEDHDERQRCVHRSDRGRLAPDGPVKSRRAISDVPEMALELSFALQPVRDSNPCLHLERVMS